MKLSERNKPYFLFLLLKHSLIYICFFVVFCQVQTDDNPINVGEDRPVEIGAAKLPAIEPYLAANPRNANYLPATVMLVSKMGDPRCLAEEDEVICAALVSLMRAKTELGYFIPLNAPNKFWMPQ
jgi:hypothetical protein